MKSFLFVLPCVLLAATNPSESEAAVALSFVGGPLVRDLDDVRGLADIEVPKQNYFRVYGVNQVSYLDLIYWPFGGDSSSGSGGEWSISVDITDRFEVSNVGESFSFNPVGDLSGAGGSLVSHSIDYRLGRIEFTYSLTGNLTSGAVIYRFFLRSALGGPHVGPELGAGDDAPDFTVSAINPLSGNILNIYNPVDVSLEEIVGYDLQKIPVPSSLLSLVSALSACAFYLRSRKSGDNQKV